MYKKLDRVIYVLLVLIMAAALIKSFVIDPGNGKVPEEILQKADVNMYAKKQKMKNAGMDE